MVYQIYPRSFADSNGDGIGDIRGIIERLDYLHDLGVEIVWLSPFFASPQDDNGYDVSDYQAVAPEFGTLGDIDELIVGLHERDMRFVMDLVVNHTSDEHPWFVESRSSTDNPKRDWYWWAPPRDGAVGGEPGAEPTNWAAAFADSAWEFDEATGEYYLHLFSRKQPDLNWENPQVRQGVYAMMRWWLERGVDGFRMDVINFISKVLPLGDVPSQHGEFYGDAGSEFENGPRIHEFMAEMHREVLGASEKVLVTVGEMPGVSVEQAARYTDPQRRELDMVFTFEHVNLDGDPSQSPPVPLKELRANLSRWQTGLHDVGWNSLYWDNHDQPRAVSRFGNPSDEFRERSAKLLATVLHGLRGTPYVYQGEELGMTNSPFVSIEEYQDIQAHHQHAQGLRRDTVKQVMAWLAYRGRDHARAPMQWDDSSHAGFTTGTPWLPVNPNFAEINAAAQVDDPSSVLSHYKSLIRLRKDDPVLVHGRYELLAAEDEQVFAFARTWEDRQLLVFANFSDEPATATLSEDPASSRASVVLGNYPDTPSLGRDVALRPWEAIMLRRG